MATAAGLLDLWCFLPPADVSIDEFMMRTDHFIKKYFGYIGNHIPSTVHGLDWLNCKSGGHQVVSIVSASAHQEQAFDLPYYKDQAALCEAGTSCAFSVRSHSKLECVEN